MKHFSEIMEGFMRPYIPKIVQKHLEPKKRVGVLISGSGTNLQALIDATQDSCRHMKAEIVVVISNKSNVEGLNRATRAGIPIKVKVIFEICKMFKIPYFHQNSRKFKYV